MFRSFKASLLKLKKLFSKFCFVKFPHHTIVRMQNQMISAFRNLHIHQFIGISSSFDCRVKLTKSCIFQINCTPVELFQINCTPVKLKGVMFLSSCLISSVTSRPSINLDILSEVIFSFVRVNSFKAS